MSLEQADKIAKAVLYEGYLLYPYTPASKKNRQRWTFGGVYPETYVERNEGSDLSEIQSECLIDAAPGARVSIRLRFLHLIARLTPASSPLPISEFDRWEEAREREVLLSDLEILELCSHPRSRLFSFDGQEMAEADTGIVRLQHRIEGELSVTARRVGERLVRITTRLKNTSPEDPRDRSQALLHSMLSTHFLFSAENADFISLIDPPESCRRPVDQCRNVGTWPVLVGDPSERSLLLSAPIILYDFPQIAPESPGDLFDGTEIDEILSLRILTLTEEEKAEIRASDERGRQLLERTEKLTEDDLLRLHGALRDAGPSLRLGSIEVRPGSRVRLCPKNPSDVFDIALKGMTATVQSIEQDLENHYHLSVTLDDDPGRDLGMQGQPGHRFFFRPEDVEPL